MKYYQTIIMENKEIDGILYYCFNEENYKKISEEREEQLKEIERLNNKLKEIKSQLDYLETYSSKEDVFEDMKRRLDRIDKIIGSDK